MTTVKRFKEWLNRFPDDTIINVIKQEPASMYQSYGECVFEDIKLVNSDIGDGWEFIDFTNNQFVKEGDMRHGMRYLRLGEKV